MGWRPRTPGPRADAPAAGARLPVGIARRSRGPEPAAAPVDPNAPAPLPGGLTGLFLRFVRHMAWLAAAAVVIAHMLFADGEHPLVVRVLSAVPAVLLIFEARAFVAREERELPFLVLGLLQFYMAFGFGVFFRLPYYDLNGPVTFSTEARVSAGLAVSIGALAMIGGARLGARLARDFRRPLLQLIPPAEVPSGWDRAFYTYAGAAVLVAMVTIFSPDLIPQAIALPVQLGFAVPFAMGLSLAFPSRPYSQRESRLFLGLGAAMGMLRGELEPIFRTGMAYVSARWGITRRVSFQVVAAAALVFAVLQPVKHSYREQIWGKQTRETVGLQSRVDAWENAFDTYLGNEGHARSVDDTSSVNRISEFNAVEHVFDVVPSRVDFLWGESLLEIVYSPIPRFIWANKPVTKNSLSQRYAVIFGRQTDVGARSTAINLPLLVEGYWNFGWAGIVAVCVAMGLWLGFQQRLLAGTHWALRSIGVANIAYVTVGSHIVGVYSIIFQTMTARIAMCWIVYGIAVLSSARHAARPVGLSAAGMRRAPSR